MKKAMLVLVLLAGCYVEERPRPYYRRPAPCAGGIWVAGHYGVWHRWHPGHWRCGEREIIIEER